MNLIKPMGNKIDKFTGKQVDKISDLLPEDNGQFCDCGTELINRCYICGAPICCPACCEQTQIANSGINKYKSALKKLS